jgi:rod shape-determining protein MreC
LDNIIKRHANLSILVAVLFAQILGLAIQIKRPTGETSDGTMLLRQWTVSAITPMEKAFVHSTGFFRNTWNNYFYLRNVRRENEQLRGQIQQMRLEQVRIQQDAAQARRLQALLAFKEEYISETVPAQVIGTSGSEQSRVIYIDRGGDHGLKENMPVITPDGIVGKVLRVFPGTAQVLIISDQTSGVGVILEKSRLQGILRGSADGSVNVEYIMADEKVEPGEPILSSGGDKVFPKGLPIGRVAAVAPGKNMFLHIRVTPAAELNRLEEVLVITKIVEKAPDANELKGILRASDILAERLPSVPVKPPADDKTKPATTTSGTQPAANAPQQGTTQPAAPKPNTTSPATNTANKTTATPNAVAVPAKTMNSAPTKQPVPSSTTNSTAKKPATTTPNPVTTKPAADAQIKKPATKPSAPAPQSTTIAAPSPTAQEH